MSEQTDWAAVACAVLFLLVGLRAVLFSRRDTHAAIRQIEQSRFPLHTLSVFVMRRPSHLMEQRMLGALSILAGLFIIGVLSWSGGRFDGVSLPSPWGPLALPRIETDN